MKIFTGKVVAKKMEKTATIVVERLVAHPMYGKRIRKSKKYHVHDEMKSNVGDTVKFVASKPYSKLKKWRITEIVKNSSNNKGKKTKKKVNKEIKKKK